MKKRSRYIAALMTTVMLMGSLGMTGYAEEAIAVTETETVMETEEAVVAEISDTLETEEAELIDASELEETEAAETDIEDMEETVVETEADQAETETEEAAEEASEEESETEVIETLAYTGKITDLKAQSTTSGVKLTWSKVAGASGYIICGIRGDSGKYGLIGNTVNLTYTDAQAMSNQFNFYWVYPYSIDSKGAIVRGQAPTKYVYGYKSLPAISGFAASSCFDGVKLSWNKVPDAEGYLVYGIRHGGKYEKLVLTLNTYYTDTLAPIEGYSFYWVVPYNKLAGKVMTGAFPKYKYGKAYYAYSADDVKFVNDKVTIVPKHVYYDSKNKRIVAECYIANGKDKSVYNLNVNELTLKSSTGSVVCTKNFGAISAGTIGAKKSVDYTFYFSGSDIKSMAGPAKMSYYAKVSYLTK